MNIYNEVITYNKLKIILEEKIDHEEFSSLVSKYGYTREYIEHDSLLSIYYSKKKNYFDDHFDELRKKYMTSLNLKLREMVLEMKEQDQLYRKKNY